MMLTNSTANQIPYIKLRQRRSGLRSQFLRPKILRKSSYSAELVSLHSEFEQQQSCHRSVTLMGRQMWNLARRV